MHTIWQNSVSVRTYALPDARAAFAFSSHRQFGMQHAPNATFALRRDASLAAAFLALNGVTALALDAML